MQRTNVYLDDDQLRALKHLAAEEGLSLAELVRQAVDRLLAARGTLDPSWQERLERVVGRIREHAPPGVRPEEIEADITTASNEVRRGRRR